MYFKFAII
jgi:PAS domain S-box-containing protein